jgi:hypothetical protein
MYVRPLEKVREGYINDMMRRTPDMATEKFAPRVLKIVHAQSGRDQEQEIQDLITDEVRRKPQEFPLLVWTLCDADSNPVPADERDNFDLSSSSKLRHLPQIANGLHSLYQAVKETSEHVNSNKLVGAFLDRMESKDAKAFAAAWDACRGVGNYECQGNIDLGELRHLPVKTLLDMRDGRDGTSYSGLLLSKLVQVHNSQMQHLHKGASYQTLPIHKMEPHGIGKHLFPWRDARESLSDFFTDLVLQGQQPINAARDAEIFLREWLKGQINEGELKLTGFSLPKVVWNAEDRMPSFQQVPNEMVLLRAENIFQASALPPESEKEIDDFFQEHGLLLDRVHLALEFIKKVSLWVLDELECDPGKISADLSLKEKIQPLCGKPPQKPSLLDVIERNEKLCIKHLNALQRHLSSMTTAKPEDELDAKYRMKLSTDQMEKLSSSPDSKQTDLLLRKLLAFVGILRQNQYPETLGMKMYGDECVALPFMRSHMCEDLKLLESMSVQS